ncbi:MAG: hypothetical protein II675_03980, partial [Bacteroidaceae bacterium]|nr:hypothetical protein [Bacteroidaceae bacterium]
VFPREAFFIPAGGVSNAARGNCQRRTRGCPSPHAAFFTPSGRASQLLLLSLLVFKHDIVNFNFKLYYFNKLFFQTKKIEKKF